MTRLEAAIEQKQWELVWLYLCLGVTEAASSLPPESMSASSPSWRAKMTSPEKAAVMANATGRVSRRLFYENALTEAERAAIAAALEVEGIDQEIAAVRLRIRTAIEEHPEDLALILRGMDVLRRLVVTRYGLSRGDQREMTAWMVETAKRMKQRGEGRSNDTDA